ncbi:MAG TPA: lysophospholipid acyltransferase family protein [Patescibacteria group bacterium]|nr:lysophospholipid acyltransferase family protein [Patescibacteria group bacterium]
MSDEEKIVRCEALTKAASRCKNKAEPGSVTCWVHRSLAVKLGAQRPSVERFAEQNLSDRELRERLMAELDDLIIRVQGISPEYSPPPFSPEKMVDLLDEQGEDGDSSFRLALLKRLRGSINEDILDIETWKGAWYMVNYTIEYQGDIVKRRLKGDYETDAWGLDWEFIEAVRPFLDFMYKVYWRVETTGIEHISDYERALLVGNHSGQLPWDGAMLMTALLNEHPAQRLVRNLYSKWLPTLPFMSSILVKMGQALDSVENGVRLLEQEELVGVFPEGYNGVGKLFRNRYKLARFGRDGFVKMALNAQAPIIPVSIVGAEETYITLGKSSTLARLTGFPYFPISLRFPWLGLLGVVPLPTKWYIDIGQPIPMDDYGSDAAVNPALLSQLTDKVRNVIQEMVNNRLEQRRAIFF